MYYHIYMTFLSFWVSFSISSDPLVKQSDRKLHTHWYTKSAFFRYFDLLCFSIAHRFVSLLKWCAPFWMPFDGSFLHIFQMCIILLAKWCLLSEMDISYRNETRTCAYFKRQRNTKNALLFHNTIYYMMIKLKERLTKFSVSRIKYFWFSLKWWKNSRGENPPSQLQYLRNPFDSFVFQ